MEVFHAGRVVAQLHAWSRDSATFFEPGGVDPAGPQSGVRRSLGPLGSQPGRLTAVVSETWQCRISAMFAKGLGSHWRSSL